MFIVTGGGTGIGRALAYALAQRGKPVLIIGRREEFLIETASLSPLIHFLCADISTHQGRIKVLRELKPSVQLDGLIHNAGVVEPIESIAKIDEERWHQTFSINVDGPLFLTQLLLDKLKGARVLMIGTAAAYFPIQGWAAYCCSKASLAMLTRCFQLDVKETHFSSVMPGIVDTDMQAIIRHADHMDADKKQFFNSLKAEESLLSPETVGLFLAWLLLDTSSTVFCSKEWDIYEKSHHSAWLTPSHRVPSI